METNNESNKGISYEDYILSMCERIEIGISNGLYPAPSELFMEKITSLGFTSFKSYLIDSQSAIFSILQSKTDEELAALNIGDIKKNSINGSEINDTESYEYQLGKMIIFEMALDVRKAKASKHSIDFSDYNISFSLLTNLIDDLSYLKNKEIYKEEIAFLKAEIKKPSFFKVSKTDNNEIEYFKGKTNQFNKVPLLQVFRYFMQLVDETENSFLTKEEVIKFIDKAFCGNKSLESITIQNIKGKKSLIQDLFHNFYADCTNDFQYEVTKHSKEKYVKLITDNFTNWEFSKVFKNFPSSKSKYWKRLSEFK